ncbi:MAG: hypothetical protein ACYDD9_07825 [Acidithiobacillus sp.]|uniref:hypothetical protein n=1 Tax=Acidithiobacillus ferrooxidans TaxID=920 RepID=UPI00214B0802|nr:hypothetical protein [Acidithiobacillus ferrooxidans]MCR2830476.1 hypothetical protein [Acidithiobacillus ferrooxidans]
MIDYYGKLIKSETNINKRIKLLSEGLKEVFDSFDNANKINQGKILRGMNIMMKELQNNTEEECGRPPALSLRLPLSRAGRTGLPHRKALVFSPIEGSKTKRRFIPSLKRGVLA